MTKNKINKDKNDKPSIEQIIISGNDFYDGLWIIIYKLFVKRWWMGFLFLAFIVASLIVLANHGIIITDIFK